MTFRELTAWLLFTTTAGFSYLAAPPLLIITLNTAVEVKANRPAMAVRKPVASPPVLAK